MSDPFTEFGIPIDVDDLFFDPEGSNDLVGYTLQPMDDDPPEHEYYSRVVSKQFDYPSIPKHLVKQALNHSEFEPDAGEIYPDYEALRSSTTREYFRQLQKKNTHEDVFFGNLYNKVPVAIYQNCKRVYLCASIAVDPRHPHKYDHAVIFAFDYEFQRIFLIDSAGYASHIANETGEDVQTVIVRLMRHASFADSETKRWNIESLNLAAFTSRDMFEAPSKWQTLDMYRGNCAVFTCWNGLWLLHNPYCMHFVIPNMPRQNPMMFKVSIILTVENEDLYIPEEVKPYLTQGGKLIFGNKKKRLKKENRKPVRVLRKKSSRKRRNVS